MNNKRRTKRENRIIEIKGWAMVILIGVALWFLVLVFTTQFNFEKISW